MLVHPPARSHESPPPLVGRCARWSGEVWAKWGWETNNTITTKTIAITIVFATERAAPRMRGPVYGASPLKTRQLLHWVTMVLSGGKPTLITYALMSGPFWLAQFRPCHNRASRQLKLKVFGGTGVWAPRPSHTPHQIPVRALFWRLCETCPEFAMGNHDSEPVMLQV